MGLVVCTTLVEDIIRMLVLQLAHPLNEYTSRTERVTLTGNGGRELRIYVIQC